MKYKIGIALLASLLVLLTGCKATPVLNIEEAAIMTEAENVSSKDIAEAIVRAGSGLGWVMKLQKGSDEIIGILHLRKHMAKVSIKYTNEFYSIQYLDSTNLNYDGTNIHNNYNGWISYLNNGIQAQLGLI